VEGVTVLLGINSDDNLLYLVNLVATNRTYSSIVIVPEPAPGKTVTASMATN